MSFVKEKLMIYANTITYGAALCRFDFASDARAFNLQMVDIRNKKK